MMIQTGPTLPGSAISSKKKRRLLGEDPWPYSLKKNRANLERFMGYSLDQSLMEKKMAVEDLFTPKTLDT